MKTCTLASMFEVNKQALVKELTGLSLPKDADKIQKTVCKYFNEMFEKDGEFRQGLTQSEDYILNAAIELLNAQQNIAKELVNGIDGKSLMKQNANDKPSDKKYHTVAGAVGVTLGTATGYLIGETWWGALSGAIVGTAIVLYGITVQNKKKPTKEEPGIDPTIFVDITKRICEKIDVLMETYRVQVNRIKYVYEQKEKPSLQKDYSALLTQIEAVYNVSKSITGLPDKLSLAVERLVESLGNYGLKIENGKIVKE